jgi:hypothetical protein
MSREALLAALALSLVACSQGSAQSEAKKLHDQLTAAGTESAACKMFSRAEISAALGAAVGEGYTSGPLGSACSWDVKGNDEQSVMVQIVSRDYWEDGTRAEGAEALTGIGEKAFIGPWIGDLRAGALTAKGAVYVMSPKREASIVLLRQAAERMPTP